MQPVEQSQQFRLIGEPDGQNRARWTRIVTAGSDWVNLEGTHPPFIENGAYTNTVDSAQHVCLLTHGIFPLAPAPYFMHLYLL